MQKKPHVTNYTPNHIDKKLWIIPKPVWAVGFALEQTLRDATLAVFSFLILKRLQHICYTEAGMGDRLRP
jgi:hypothetical protein